MATREAACHCGQLRLEVSGDPFSVSICHCLACQRRTGSAFGMQAGFKADQVAGRRSLRRLRADLGRGGQEGARLPLLPRLRIAGLLHGADRAGPDRRLGGLVRRPVVPAADGVGLRLRRHRWVGLPDSIQRFAPEVWAPVRPLYEAGRYAEAARRGASSSRRIPTPRISLQRRVLREPRGPDSRRDRAPAPGDRHVGGLLATWQEQDSDFDPIRDEPAFQELDRRPLALRHPTAFRNARTRCSSRVAAPSS